MRSHLQSLLQRRPSASMIVAVLALAVALGGTALAAPKKRAPHLNRATVAKIAKREAAAILGSQAATLKVASAETAKTATEAKTAGSAIMAQQAGRAIEAVNANQLGGRPASAYASSEGEPYRVVGAPGQPGFEGLWTGFPEGLASVAFYKDPVGVVHLRGLAVGKAKNSELTSIYTLPAGYRPSATLYFNIFDIEETQPLYVFPNGTVQTACPFAGCYAPLDGVSFRAEQ
jgi:hypothetical protein